MNSVSNIKNINGAETGCFLVFALILPYSFENVSAVYGLFPAWIEQKHLWVTGGVNKLVTSRKLYTYMASKLGNAARKNFIKISIRICDPPNEGHKPWTLLCSDFFPFSRLWSGIISLKWHLFWNFAEIFMWTKWANATGHDFGMRRWLNKTAR